MRTRLVHILAFMLFVCTATVQARDFTLVIDAGHGGKDPGAMRKGVKESHINLAVALAFGDMVKRNCKGVKVVYTRDTDKFVTLDGRADIANKAKADLFISIHTNALEKGKQLRGAETYTLGMHRAEENLEVAKRENSVISFESDNKTRYEGFDPNSSESYIIFELIQDRNMKQSVNFARHMQREFKKAGRVDRGVHQAGFLVLRATSMPSALIELGYISTPSEAQYLASKAGQENLAKAIYRAFLAYRKGSASTAPLPAPPRGREETAASDNLPETPETKVTASPLGGTGEGAVVNSEAITFRVQFMVSDKELKKVKGVDKFEHYIEKGVYKYTTGRYATFAEAQRHRNQIAKTFSGAFVVAFQGDTRIDVQQAKQMKQK